MSSPMSSLGSAQVGAQVVINGRSAASRRILPWRSIPPSFASAALGPRAASGGRRSAWRRGAAPVVLVLLAGLGMAAPGGAQETRGEHGHGKKHDGTHARDLNKLGFHHDFSDAERWARIFDSPERPEWQRPQEVMDLMDLSPGMTVADIGAGTGFFLGYLSKSVGETGQVWALDVADSLVEHMNRRAEKAGWSNVEALKIPFDGPGMKARSADRILIVNTWHHIDARASYSEKLARTLKPGGSVFVIDYTLDSEHGPPEAHRLAPDQVMAELKAGGFEVELLPENLPRQYVVRAWRADAGS